MNNSIPNTQPPVSASPRLTVELVPATSWYQNVRSNVTSGEWERIKKSTFKRANYRCEICYGRGRKWPVECHEIWAYDDEHHIQELVGFQALCPKCHMVKHLGRAMNTGNGMVALYHLVTVNGWDEARARDYIQQVFAEWHERSKHAWSLNIYDHKDLELEEK